MGRKGAGTFRLEVDGKASHAGLQPEMGASAIWDLAQKVAALHALTNFEAGTTVNVGVIQGGTRPNVVADRAMTNRRPIADERRLFVRADAALPAWLAAQHGVRRDPISVHAYNGPCRPICDTQRISHAHCPHGKEVVCPRSSG